MGSSLPNNYFEAAAYFYLFFVFIIVLDLPYHYFGAPDDFYLLFISRPSASACWSIYR